MTDKHQFEQLRETFFSNLAELDLDTAAHNDVVAKLDRSINQVLMGVSANGGKPAKKELTRGQKIAASRKRNKARKEAEANNENENTD